MFCFVSLRVLLVGGWCYGWYVVMLEEDEREEGKEELGSREVRAGW